MWCCVGAIGVNPMPLLHPNVPNLRPNRAANAKSRALGPDAAGGMTCSSGPRYWGAVGHVQSRACAAPANNLEI